MSTTNLPNSAESHPPGRPSNQVRPDQKTGAPPGGRKGRGPETESRFGPTEVRRRIWHMAPGLLPFLLWPIPHTDPLSTTLQLIMIGIGVVLASWIFFGFRHIARNGSISDRLGGVGGYAGSVLAMLLLFPAHAELGLTVLGVLAFGDGSATIGGLLLRGPTLPWNRNKTWSGLLTFLLIGTPMAALIYWGESNNLLAIQEGVSFPTALLIGGGTVLAAAIAESLASRINDNIRVGIVSAVAVAVLHGILAGW